MHNYFQIMMADVNFSVTSFVFWPYHSWIDCEIEMYIRRANHGNIYGNDNIKETPFQAMKRHLN
jgi:hypothetical protein